MMMRLPLATALVLLSLVVVAAVAPGPPQNLEASVNGTTVFLTWQAPSVGGVPTEYVLDASLSPSGPNIASFGVTSTAMNVTNVPDGVYYVRVRAQNPDGASAASNEVVVVVPNNGGSECTSAPNAPESLTGSATSSLINLSWNSPSDGCGVASYSVQAGSSPGASDIAVMNVGNMTTLSASAPPGIYYVRVIAVNAYGGSVASNEVVITVGCPSAPHAPTSLSGLTAGNMVTLNWAAAASGCGATGYVVHAGSAPGLSDLAVINVSGATALSASAPPGTYFVRVEAVNDFGGSAASNEVVITVLASGTFTLGFNTFTGAAHGSPVGTYTESDFIVTTAEEFWSVSTTFGRPAPFIQFTRQADEDALTGEVSVTSGGSLFGFRAFDVYSSITPIPLEIIGFRGGTPVFSATGTVPNTFGNFATVSNPYPADLIDELRIRVTNPATSCCSNPVGLDNIVVVR